MMFVYAKADLRKGQPRLMFVTSDMDKAFHVKDVQVVVIHASNSQQVGCALEAAMNALKLETE